MISLKISDFSCIKFAEIELRPLTIVIGPQASGKSLVSKLIYFFVDIIESSFAFSTNASRSNALLRDIESRFENMFPSGSWGKNPFEIKFTAGDIQFTVRRKIRTNKPLSRVEVTASSYFTELYHNHVTSTAKFVRKKSNDDNFFGEIVSRQGWDVFAQSIRFLIKDQKSDFVENQFFVPAGRSFYSNLGKAVAMLEHGSRLDTVTMRFGRRFTSLLDGAAPYIPRERATRVRDVMKRQVSSLETIIGGKIKLSSNDKHIETRDGRIIPLGLMSSGQQELLPLLLALREYLFRNLLDEDVSSDLLYIEEPEAHLFPESQGDLIKYIVSVRNYIKHRSKMFITTHSPYVLATLNNLILASQISDKSDIFKKEVEKLVPIDSWLPADDISAYAIIDGRCVSIKSDFGLIDGIYLDGVSSNIVDTFDKLLEIDSTIDYDVN